MKIFIGSEPILFDPPLLIISPSKYSPTHPQHKDGILAPLLEIACQNLYFQAMNFTLNDDSFPNFIETIEQSIKNPNGWCYQKLREKLNQFGKPRTEATYLCITLNKPEDSKIRYSYMIKIWPAGHYSPVHNHHHTYGIIRVLFGKILVKFFPTLSTNLHRNPLIEQIFEENQVTWMVPNLNQTCQIINPDMYGPCCITIHCYQYETGDQIYCENFNFITNDGHHIEHYSCKGDNNYADFKNIMLKEFIKEHST